MLNYRILAGLILAGLTCAGFASGQTQPSTQPLLQRDETPQQHDARMQWWREARFGMFIHWGVYSVPAGVYKDKDVPGIGEWIMNRAKIPVADYAQYTDQFNPTGFDAEHWVQIAQAAGMKYIVITAKHHDGFAMFHS
ncbi:MAG TPA: alpha-L-fucosidase, partial [Tepidisphaeraceae bacterium]